MSGDPSSGTCQYICSGGVWRIAYSDPAAGYYCPPTSGACPGGGGGNTYVPPYPSGFGARLMAESPVPKNGADYIWEKGAKSIRMQRGSCTKGKCLLPEIKIKDLATIAPDVHELIESVKAQKSVKQLTVFVPAQPIKKDKKA